MKKESFLKNVCCTGDLTIAARFIAFIGILTSVLLITALLNDRVAENYDASRSMAALLGLDWRHFHPSTSVLPEDDPEGKMISIIMIFYTIVFFITNALLLMAAVFRKRYLTFPWLFCEFIGCVSKVGALIFHLISGTDNLSDTFIGGSISYFLMINWWWLAVYAAQDSWKPVSKERFELSLISIVGRDSTTEVNQSTQTLHSTFTHNKSQYDSPGPYLPNECYSAI